MPGFEIIPPKKPKDQLRPVNLITTDASGDEVVLPAGILEAEEMVDLCSRMDSGLLHKPVRLIKSYETGKGLTGHDKRLFNWLMYYARPTLLEDRAYGRNFMFAVATRDLRASLGYRKQDKNVQIFRSMNNLMEQKIVFPYLRKDGSEELGFATLVSGFSMPKRASILQWSFFPAVIPAFADFSKYGSIRLEVQGKLKSKYSVSLFEHLSAIVNLRVPRWTITVEDLQEQLGATRSEVAQVVVPGDFGANFRDWNAFYTRALRPALNEINKHAHFSVEMTTHKSRSSRRIEKVTFIVTKKA